MLVRREEYLELKLAATERARAELTEALAQVRSTVREAGLDVPRRRRARRGDRCCPPAVIVVVLDTNTLVSGLGWSGPPAQILDAVPAGQLVLASSPAPLAELERVLAYPKLARVFPDPEGLVSRLRTVVDLVEPTFELALVADEPDNRVLEAAVAVPADAVVTGDGGPARPRPTRRHPGLLSGSVRRVVVPGALIAPRPRDSAQPGGRLRFRARCAREGALNGASRDVTKNYRCSPDGWTRLRALALFGLCS